MGNEMGHNIGDSISNTIDKNFFCKKCPSFANQSVVTFSETLVLKVADGIAPDPKLIAIDEDGGETTFLTEDAYIFKKIRCIDDTHSVENGLRKRDFDRLMTKLEGLTKIERTVTQDKIDQILECYKLNPGCPLTCTEQIDDFLEYVDFRRMQAMKKKADEDRKRKKEEEIEAKKTKNKKMW